MDVTHRDCSSGNIVAPRIRRKKISRGVQYDVSVGRSFREGSSLFQCCFRPRSRKHKRTREAKKRLSVGRNESGVAHESRNQMVELPVEKIISEDTRIEQSRNSTEEEKKSIDDMNLRKEKSQPDGGEIRTSTSTNDDGTRRRNDKSENREANLRRLTLWPRKIKLRRNNSSPGQRAIRNDDFNVDSPGDEREIVETDAESKRTNSDHERDNDPQNERSVRFSDPKADSTEGRKNADPNRGNYVSEARRRLDLCIVELNEIIRDACVIFGGGKSVAKRSG